MARATPTPLTPKQHESFIDYYNNIIDNVSSSRSINRANYVKIDRDYQREQDKTEEHLRAQQANKAGDTNRFQNITVPVTMPQVETAVTYQTSVFLTGHPLFGVVASPKFIDEAVQLETTIEEQATKGGWPRHLMMFFRDGFKYNISAIDIDWAEEVTYAVETDLQVDKLLGTPKEVLWAGNTCERINPYNLLLDTRVEPTEIPKHGEFAGYTKLVSRTRLKAFINSLPDRIVGNITAALNSSTEYSPMPDLDYKGVFTPYINEMETPATDVHATNWVNWAGLDEAKDSPIDYKDVYELTKLYCRVIPSSHGLKIPAPNTPQIFKLYIVNHQHIIYAERQTNAHNLIPILVGQPYEDGLGYQTKSLATNAAPFQEVASAFMNSITASRRRAVTDRVLYDPSRISNAQINNPNPSAKIPVRPAAYGKPISESVYQFPYREDQGQFSMQQIASLLGMSNQVAGQNQASQGQFVKGNKTLHEFDSVMQNANGRDQMTSILLEFQVFQPMKQILKTNILQFQGGATIYNRDKQVEVEVDPLKLRKAILEFKISDGLIPSTKLISGDTLQTAIQVIGSSPQIAGAYNIGPMFSYLMKSQGAPIADFEKSPEQMAYEQAVQAWQQTVLEALKQGADQASLPPQPVPEQFNYNPSGQPPIQEA